MKKVACQRRARAQMTDSFAGARGHLGSSFREFGAHTSWHTGGETPKGRSASSLPKKTRGHLLAAALAVSGAGLPLTSQ